MLQRSDVVRFALALGVIAVCSGFAIAATTDGTASQEPDPQIMEQGKNLYTDQCQSCHGAEGKGDGPAARFLDPPARDLSQGAWQHATDGTVEAVAAVIKNGIDDTGMTPFEGTLSDDEISAVATYVVHALVSGGGR
jgi:mono/diheme cytochrome c family protein